MSASPLQFQEVVNTLAKLADKSFVRGFFVPALLGTFAILALNADILQSTPLFLAATREDILFYLSAAILALWVVAMLLLVTNVAAYRILEGYAWPFGSKFLLAKQIKRRREQRLMVRRVFAEMTALASRRDDASEFDGPLATAAREKQYQYLSLLAQLKVSYPEEPHLVLPTRFGNVVRAFETYPLVVYGVEGTRVWARLVAVITPEFQASLAEAKSRVDFWVSLVFLSALTGTISLVRGVGVAYHHGWGKRVAILFICAAIFVVIARALYLASVSSLAAWGEALNSAFDLYLPALARKLGYRLPRSLVERRRFWNEFSSQITFFDPMRSEDWEEFAASAPRVSRPDSEHAEADRDAEDEGDEGDEPRGDKGE